MGSGEAGDLSLPVGTLATCKKEEKVYRCTAVSICTVCICAWVGAGSFSCSCLSEMWACYGRNFLIGRPWDGAFFVSKQP